VAYLGGDKSLNPEAPPTDADVGGDRGVDTSGQRGVTARRDMMYAERS
jgi:hypothetical protein